MLKTDSGEVIVYSVYKPSVLHKTVRIMFLGHQVLKDVMMAL